MLAAIRNAPTGREQVELRPAGVGRVVADAPGHAAEAQQVLREEGQVGADEHHPELDLAQPLVRAGGPVIFGNQ